MSDYFMSASHLVRLGALATTVGGALCLVSSASFGLIPPSGALTGFVLMVVALLLVPVGMVGFHILQGRTYGHVGHAGFWLVVVGSLMTALGMADFFVWGDFLQDAVPVSLKLGPLASCGWR